MPQETISPVSSSLPLELDGESPVTQHVADPLHAIVPDPSINKTLHPPELIKDTAQSEQELLITLRGIRWLAGILCGLAIIAALYLAQAIFIPIFLSVTLYLLLRPTVRWMARRHIPESVGAIVCLLAVVILMLAIVLPVLNPARAWVDSLPKHVNQVSDKLKSAKQYISQFTKVRTQIEDLAAGQETTSPVKVTVQEPELTSSAFVLSTTGNMLGMWLVVIVLTSFLLISGDTLLNNLLTILPTIHEKRQAVELIKEIERGISSYLVTITMINLGLGTAIAMMLWLMGVPNPIAWGLMTAVLNYIPFVGQGIAGVIIGFVALLNFDSIGYALLVPVAFYSIAAVEGNVITPALLGHNMSLNPILVLISLLCWGWLWGITGAALAVPLLAMFKIGCDRFECTKPVGKLLGG